MFSDILANGTLITNVLSHEPGKCSVFGDSYLYKLTQVNMLEDRHTPARLYKVAHSTGIKLSLTSLQGLR
jgi:hypothetical protein